jgi:hypothetical protein
MTTAPRRKGSFYISCSLMVFRYWQHTSAMFIATIHVVIYPGML